VYGQEEIVELVYSGDSTFQGLLDVPQQLNDYLRDMQFSAEKDEKHMCHPVLQTINLDFLFSAEVLIMEMTYLDGEVDKAVSRGHVHLQEFVTHGHMFNNRYSIGYVYMRCIGLFVFYIC
jgi:hypothetical protein